MARVWLPKPIYESLPYYYLVAGVISLGAALYLDFWYWPYIGVTAGFACLVAGLAIGQSALAPATDSSWNSRRASGRN